MSISKYFAASPTKSERSASFGITTNDSHKREVIQLSDDDEKPAQAIDPTSKNESHETLAQLQDRWRVLYTETLPEAARDKSDTQSKWPVSLDHCFARIILDNAVGKDKPWTQAIKSPAIKNMSVNQLKAALKLGNKILDGSTSLVELDEKSLQLRGKQSKAAKAASSNPKKRALPTESEETSSLSKKSKGNYKNEGDEDALQDSKELEAIIDSSDKTDFQKKCLKLLTQIPSGQFSTYGAMSKFLGSSPRAVGNAMRGNPFAPRVPCHRILAADRSIGGFGGDWGANGKHVIEKLRLLTAEGVKFDSKGKVLGRIFEGFHSV